MLQQQNTYQFKPISEYLEAIGTLDKFKYSPRKNHEMTYIPTEVNTARNALGDLKRGIILTHKGPIDELSLYGSLLSGDTSIEESLHEIISEPQLQIVYKNTILTVGGISALLSQLSNIQDISKLIPTAERFGLFGGYDFAMPNASGGFTATKFYGFPEEMENLFQLNGITNLGNKYNIERLFNENTVIKDMAIDLLDKLIPGAGIADSISNNLLASLQTIFGINKYGNNLFLEAEDDWESLMEAYKDGLYAIKDNTSDIEAHHLIKAIRTILRAYEDSAQMEEKRFGNEAQSPHELTDFQALLIPYRPTEEYKATLERVANLKITTL